MAVNAKTVQTYNNLVIRESLAEQYSMISPEETPFQKAIGKAPTADQPHHEWPILSLAAPDPNNRVIEGDDAPPVDDASLPTRVGNFTQISDKRVKTSHTSEASDAAAEDVHKLSKQIALKLREMKRDKEVMLLSNVAANPGSSGVARVTAGMPAWLRTNTSGGAGGADPTLSATNNGYPNAAAVVGTLRELTEEMLGEAIADAWTTGGQPTIAMVTAKNKSLISDTFTGNSTRYKDSIDKKLVAAVDVYDSDFGEVTIVPNRFQPVLNPAAAPAAQAHYLLLLDPDYAGVSYLENVKQKPLAETGHSKDRLVWCEYALQVDNEAAHGIIRDLTNGAL